MPPITSFHMDDTQRRVRRVGTGAVVIGALLLLVLGGITAWLAPHSNIPSVAVIAPTSRATEVPTAVPTVAATTIPTSYTSDDPRAIPAEPHAAATAYATDCGKDWYTTTNQDVLHRCAELKAFALGDEEERHQTAIAALPSLTPAPTWVWDGTPFPTSPADRVKAEIGPDVFSPYNRPSFLRDALGLWHIGAVSEMIETGNVFVQRLYLVSYTGCSLGTMLLDPVMTEQLGRYIHVWECSQPIGDLTITNVTGIDGIVSFTSTTGTTGTLNMATGAWQFTNPIIMATPVIPTAVVLLIPTARVEAAP